ncbi:MAG: hypothetical protein Q8908_11840, partial [Bacteroidota bacterium]|nr:hypothetical protein [Bacteroidota bacterium]
TYRDFQKRLLYREALKGILTEKIRLRTDKGEGARIAYSLKNSREGISYLSDLLDSIPQNEETNIFHHRLLCELGTQSPDSIKGQIHQASDLTLYIKYLRLKREYEDPVHSL